MDDGSLKNVRPFWRGARRKPENDRKRDKWRQNLENASSWKSSRRIKQSSWWQLSPLGRMGQVRSILMGLAGIAVLGSGILVGEQFLQPVTEPINTSRVSVVDGDTIRILGANRSVRLVGFNAPESRRPQCGLEGKLGNTAKNRLRQLVASSDLEFAYVRCACRPGTEGTNRCNFGRDCGTLRAGGRDVGKILISERLAVPYVCGQTSCPPSPRPWC